MTTLKYHYHLPWWTEEKQNFSAKSNQSPGRQATPGSTD
jgi:hypothetical protein